MEDSTVENPCESNSDVPVNLEIHGVNEDLVENTKNEPGTDRLDPFTGRFQLCSDVDNGKVKVKVVQNVHCDYNETDVTDEMKLDDIFDFEPLTNRFDELPDDFEVSIENLSQYQDEILPFAESAELHDKLSPCIPGELARNLITECTTNHLVVKLPDIYRPHKESIFRKSTKGLKKSHSSSLKKNSVVNIQSSCKSQERPKLKCNSNMKNNQFVKKIKLVKTHCEANATKRPYKCEVCHKAFTQSYKLDRHVRVHNHEKRAYRCEECHKTFTKLSALTKHIRVHTGEQPYKCEVCNETFSCSSDLRKHTRIHTGERPYKCEVCNKTFTHRSALRTHRILHTGDRPYKRKVRGKTFNVSSRLVGHGRVHSKERAYKCEVCSKTFTRSYHLIVHGRVHTGERPYKCDVCNKTFSDSSNFRKHGRAHIG